MQDEESLKSHAVFDDLAYMREFYSRLSTGVFQWCRSGVQAIGNIDSYLYSSAAGTLDSISLVLGNARIADAYALLRRFHDAAILNIYVDELSEEWKISLSSNSDKIAWQKEIGGWISGDTALPEYRKMSQTIRQSKRLTPINDILYSDERYKLLRDRCNSHTHFNFYHNVLANDNDIHLPQRTNMFSKIRFDIIDLAILHMSYVFFAMPHYLMSSDYMDCRECGFEPDEGSEYWVAPYLQEFFDKYFKTRRTDLAKLILDRTSMQLS
jgi:hypothetical protein